MTDDCRQQLRRARRIPFPKLAIVAVIIAGAALASACSQPSDSQQTAQQQAPDEQARKEADEKAWADAEKAGPAAAFTDYVQKFGSGAHVAEARQRAAALDEQSRKEADEKAWADAEKAGTASAFTSYVQKFGSGAHVAEGRKRAAARESQGRKEVPTIDIQQTCQAAAGVMVSLMGGTTTDQDINACLDSEQKARDQVVKDRATYSSADKVQCMRT